MRGLPSAMSQRKDGFFCLQEHCMGISHDEAFKSLKKYLVNSAIAVS
jgi:hypothetical protein